MTQSENQNNNTSQNNKRFYDALSVTPENAKRPIAGGKLEGFTDINPMHRISALTELFGPVGFGWTCRVINQWSEDCGTKKFVFVEVELKVRDPKTGQWSEPIYGNGGNSMSIQGDEAYKCAYTDALGTACKSLGMSADVYWNTEKTKYVDPVKNAMKDAGLGQKNETRNKIALTPQSAVWATMVTKFAKSSYPAAKCVQKARELYTLSEENAKQLLKEAGKI